MRYLFPSLLPMIWLGLGTAFGADEKRLEGALERLRSESTLRAVALVGGYDTVKKELDDLPSTIQRALYYHLDDRSPGERLASEVLAFAHLAKTLNMPRNEVRRADDAALVTAPHTPEVWANRARFYESGSDPKERKWALDMYKEAWARVDLHGHGWLAAFSVSHGVPGLELASSLGTTREWHDLIKQKIVNATSAGLPNEVEAWSPHVDSLLLHWLRSIPVQKDTVLINEVLDLLDGRCSFSLITLWKPLMQQAQIYDRIGLEKEARRLSKMLFFAPVPHWVAMEEEEFAVFWKKSDELGMCRGQLPGSLDWARVARASYEEMREAWRALDTHEIHASLPWETLQLAALRESRPDFRAKVDAQWRSEPWNETLLFLQLLEIAPNEEHGAGVWDKANSLPMRERLRLAVLLVEWIPRERRPIPHLSRWLLEGLSSEWNKNDYLKDRMILIHATQALHALMDMDQRSDPLLYVSMEVLRSAIVNRDDVDLWARLAHLTYRADIPGQASLMLSDWEKTLDHTARDGREHLPAISSMAVRLGKDQSAQYARLAYRIWLKSYGDAPYANAMDTSSVAEALLICGQRDEFDKLVNRLWERTRGQSPSHPSRAFASELRSVQEMYQERGRVIPDVVGHIRPAASIDGLPGAPTLSWHFVMPTIPRDSHNVTNLPATKGPNVGGEPIDPAQEGRWWRVGWPVLLPETFDHRYDMEVYAGNALDDLRPLETIKRVTLSGSIPLPKLESSRFFQLVLRDTHHGTSRRSAVQLCSHAQPLHQITSRPVSESLLVTPAKPLSNDWSQECQSRWGELLTPLLDVVVDEEYLLTSHKSAPHRHAFPGEAGQGVATVKILLFNDKKVPIGVVPLASSGLPPTPDMEVLPTPYNIDYQRFTPTEWVAQDDLVIPKSLADHRINHAPVKFMALVAHGSRDQIIPPTTIQPYGGQTAAKNVVSPPLPVLIGEPIAHIGHDVVNWHVTVGPAAKGAVFAGRDSVSVFDTTRIPWKLLALSHSDELDGNEWPLCLGGDRALIVEPAWSRTRKLGVRLMPFGDYRPDYTHRDHRELPLPSYDQGELAHTKDGAVLMVNSRPGPNPEPVAAWLAPDGSMSYVRLPRPPLTGSAGLTVAWWGPGARFTLHEDGFLFEMEHTDELRLLSVKPGSPDDMPKEASPGPRISRWVLEKPDILAERNPKGGGIVRRFRLDQRCTGKPIVFKDLPYLLLFTADHRLIRVNPPHLMSQGEG